MTAVIKNDTGDSSGTKLWRGDRRDSPGWGRRGEAGQLGRGREIIHSRTCHSRNPTLELERGLCS